MFWNTWSAVASRTRRRTYQLQPNLLPVVPPEDLDLVSVSPRGTRQLLSNSHPWAFQPLDKDPRSFDPNLDSYLSIDDAFGASFNASHVLLDTATIPDDKGVAIAAAISTSTAAAVSDSSFDPHISRGTSAFIISTAVNTSIDLLSGTNFVTGLPEDQSAYQSELAGIIGVLASVAVLVAAYNINSGSITIALDGESALNESKGNWHLQVSQPLFDYLKEIRNRIKALPIPINWHWVHGHQKEQGIQKLDWWANMNDLVDSNAK